MGLYICGIGDFMDLRGLELATEARRARVLAYRRAEDRARSLAAGLLLRRVCGVDRDGLLAYGENGKPYLKDGGLHFNISHSGLYAALAVSESEVGVDIEKTAPYSEAVSERCFRPEERAWLSREGSEAAFYYLWTGKESVMKALGLGFGLPPSSFSVLPQGGAAVCRAAGKTLFLDWLEHDGHVVCRALSGRAEKGGLAVMSARDLLR